jgi:glutamate---cysteine ligase / carboxylate-amine ligase
VRHRFGAAPPWTLGIEEELFLVDAVTFETAPAYSRLLTVPGTAGGPAVTVPGTVNATAGVKPELFECLVELYTGVVPGAGAALAELGRLRAELARRIAPHGVVLHAAGTHALARGEGQPILPGERYDRLVEALGDGLYRQLVCGLHVHVSMPDPGTCLSAFEAVVPWLPTLLALSANSAFAEGEDTGARSERAGRLLELPTGGTPPVLTGWDDWTAATRGDDTRRHWDAWPRPEYGTLEVRVMDVPTDVRRSAGLAAIVQALAADASAGAPEPYDRALYARRRARAATDRPEPAELDGLAAAVEPAARRLGGWELARQALSGRPEAERQREVAAAAGIAAVPRNVVARTVQSAS